MIAVERIRGSMPVTRLILNIRDSRDPRSQNELFRLEVRHPYVTDLPISPRGGYTLAEVAPSSAIMGPAQARHYAKALRWAAALAQTLDGWADSRQFPLFLPGEYVEYEDENGANQGAEVKTVAMLDAPTQFHYRLRGVPDRAFYAEELRFVALSERVREGL